MVNKTLLRKTFDTLSKSDYIMEIEEYLDNKLITAGSTIKLESFCLFHNYITVTTDFCQIQALGLLF